MDPHEVYLRQRVKDELRRRMRAIRRALPAAARAERSARITERALALPEIAGARCVAGFVAIHKEADPSAILEAKAKAGARVSLPVVDEATAALRLRAWRPGDPLNPGAFGIPEPAATAPEVAPAEVEVVLVPGLAFDPRGHRIGYGKGFYDRLLAKMPQAFAVGLGYDFQLVSEIGELPHDVPLDAVVTDTRTLRVESGP